MKSHNCRACFIDGTLILEDKLWKCSNPGTNPFWIGKNQLMLLRKSKQDLNLKTRKCLEKIILKNTLII